MYNTGINARLNTLKKQEAADRRFVISRLVVAGLVVGAILVGALAYWAKRDAAMADAAIKYVQQDKDMVNERAEELDHIIGGK